MRVPRKGMKTQYRGTVVLRRNASGPNRASAQVSEHTQG